MLLKSVVQSGVRNMLLKSVVQSGVMENVVEECRTERCHGTCC